MTSRAATSQEDPDAIVADAERLLRQGEPLLAYNTADTGLQRWPGHRRLRQLQGLALARGGDVERANSLLDELARTGLDDAETLGGLARTHKDLGMRAAETARRDAHLESAYRLYAQAYASSRQRGDTTGAFYTGINAATVAVLRGEIEAARWIAAEVRDICEREAKSPVVDSPQEYWRLATLGEAALILGDAPAAAVHFAAAMSAARGRFGDLSTTRRQARLLARYLPLDDSWLDEVLHIPPVLVFTGHMVDHHDRASPRFPLGLEPAVRAAIGGALRRIAPLAAYGSAACGADILCLELAQEIGSEIHVVLPFPADEFRRTSVESAPGDWGPRFDRLLEAAGSVTIASDHRATGSTATFEYSNLMMTGLARLRAELLDTSLHGLAIWDREATGAPSGSTSLVSLWEQRGMPVQHIDLSRLREERTGPSFTSAATNDLRAPGPDAHPHRIKALLFADAVGYSQLSEDQIPRYVESFLGAVAGLNRSTSRRWDHVETAGDGLYMVFPDATDAAHYALELSSLVNGTDWTAHGLPPGFNLRIALHCGPIHCGVDPVTGSRLFTGPHTSRAARIEPITPPGQVYASSAFAAVAATGGLDGIAMRYVGRIPLAKRSGTLALYHLHPAR